MLLSTVDAIGLLLQDEARNELQFWSDNISRLNGRPIWFESGATRVAFSDTRSTGYGSYVVSIGASVAYGIWFWREAQQNSTWRELKAVEQVLRLFALSLAGHAVKWFMDNKNVVRIVSVGSRRPHLQDGALSIFEACLAHGIQLEMAWIPRTLNEKADYISRIVVVDDWQLDYWWGPHSYNWFVSPHNTQPRRFYSKI